MKTAYVYDEEYGWINVGLFICTLKAELKKIENKMIVPLTQPKVTVDDHRQYVKICCFANEKDFFKGYFMGLD